jgi:glutamate synthase domain-containing protein 3
VRPQDSPLPGALDWTLIEHCPRGGGQPAPGRPASSPSATSTAPSAACCRPPSPRCTARRAAAGTIRFTLRGSAGQSFGAWLAPGVELTLIGDANDYTGKGLSGRRAGRAAGPDAATFKAEENVVIGNTVLYGATVGPRVLPRAGRASASRCATPAPRRSVEGVGDHGCEYMTGGRP